MKEKLRSGELRAAGISLNLWAARRAHSKLTTLSFGRAEVRECDHFPGKPLPMSDHPLNK